jgi:hypothetical protein
MTAYIHTYLKGELSSNFQLKLLFFPYEIGKNQKKISICINALPKNTFASLERSI